MGQGVTMYGEERVSHNTDCAEDIPQYCSGVTQEKTSPAIVESWVTILMMSIMKKKLCPEDQIHH